MKQKGILLDDEIDSISGGQSNTQFHRHEREICPSCAFGRLEFSRPNRFSSNEGTYYCSTCHNYITLSEN